MLTVLLIAVGLPLGLAGVIRVVRRGNSRVADHQTYRAPASTGYEGLGALHAMGGAGAAGSAGGCDSGGAGSC
ncbi:hypothetical protein [Actinoplanes teichomyceticus]|uniref:Uncharacterized protein n=1 Tax=Actinoplanes teichomyceticus TaxID=1867 RepID=A0A561WRS9_ACTTI|nr:hypothetical protein [Actinoplanes teichomyceticus]TWG26559.1 hypothetical protein FHX34_1011547 [Actinoplanes teichomyceticus]GIF16957.1 hypothetical protein Ate01nite_69890 [Actinoplanes teichomyceticus]